MRVCTYACMYVCMFACTHACMHACMHVYVFMYASNICSYVHVWVMFMHRMRAVLLNSSSPASSIQVRRAGALPLRDRLGLSELHPEGPRCWRGLKNYQYFGPIFRPQVLVLWEYVKTGLSSGFGITVVCSADIRIYCQCFGPIFQR